MKSNGDTMKNNNGEKERILLMLLPFWSPLTPPLGISCLKSFLKPFNYNIKTVDVNIIPQFWEVHEKYLKTLRAYIPEEKQGNFYMVGYDVLMNHLMAHINHEDEKKYRSLVKILIAKNFFVDVDEIQVDKLTEVAALFYSRLENYLLDLFEKERPSILGISVYNSTLAPSLFAFKLMKKIYPQVRTVMGGGIFADQLSIDSPNLKLFIEQIPYIDKIIIGEGEHLFLKLLQGELPKEQKIFTLRDFDGKILDLSSLDIPDFSDFDVQMYLQLASYASRSCPFHCSFCSETQQWGKYRKKNVKQVVNELIKLSEIYDRQLFLLGDSLINPLISDLAREFKERNRKSKIYWDAYLRADHSVFKPGNAELWRQGGFYRARLGIESGSPKVLDLMNKKVSVEQIKKSLIALANAGIKTTTYWVLGHPGETEQDFRQTLELITQLKDFIYEVDWHPFFFYPTGQVNSEKWAGETGISLLYPETMTDMLITPTWELKAEPSREEIYDRVCRFAIHCQNLSLPNPYSIFDIYEADERWKHLHQNAVPPLIELRTGATYIEDFEI